ncbi:hypothetical protein [Moorena producens]|uniref:hypothetical protein n=1 Tax=Moorena producens TaxID=1155739 RepID=UPI003C76551F
MTIWIDAQLPPTLAASPWVVRYGAGCCNTSAWVEHEDKPAPNAPYALIPCSLFPVPCSLIFISVQPNMI